MSARNTFSASVFAASTILLSAFSAFAQEVVTHSEKEGQRLFRGLLENEARALSLGDTDEYSIIELVDLMMVVRISRLLELNDDESVTLFGRMHKYLDALHRLKWDRGAIQHYLRIDIETDADEEVIREKLDRAVNLEIQIAGVLKKLVQESGKQLTAKQEAQLFLFSFDFESEIRKFIRQAEDIAAERHGPLAGRFRERSSNNDPEQETKESEGDEE